MYQNTHGIFHRIRTNNPKICVKPQKTPNSQSNLENENKAGSIMLCDFKPYYKTIVIKIVWHWHKKTHRSME